MLGIQAFSHPPAAVPVAVLQPEKVEVSSAEPEQKPVAELPTYKITGSALSGDSVTYFFEKQVHVDEGEDPITRSVNSSELVAVGYTVRAISQCHAVLERSGVYQDAYCI